MVQAREQIVAGTAKEITAYLQAADFGSAQLRLIVPAEDESDLFPNPPITIRDQAHLEELLLEGINSGEATPMTTQEWDDIRHEVHARAAQRSGKS